MLQGKVACPPVKYSTCNGTLLNCIVMVKKNLSLPLKYKLPKYVRIVCYFQKAGIMCFLHFSHNRLIERLIDYLTELKNR